MLIAPEESDVLSRSKSDGRVENFQVQTERVAQGGEGMSENAKTKREQKWSFTFRSRGTSREQAFQPGQPCGFAHRLWMKRRRNCAIGRKTRRSRSRLHLIQRDPDGRNMRTSHLRGPMKNYNALQFQLFRLAGKVENVSVQRQDAAADKSTKPMHRPICRSKFIVRAHCFVRHRSHRDLTRTIRRARAQSCGVCA